MNQNNQKIVTRFAPSPTGFMHVGGIRTALYAYLWARKNNGTFILRIEDTDKEREVVGSLAHIMESLEWLGISWDEGPEIGGPNSPYIQSERLKLYRDYAQILIDKGYAYPDPYKEEELEKFRKEAEEKKQPFLFRNHRPEKFDVWDGTKPLRFCTPEIKRYSWNDLVYGDLSAGEEALDDFILIKSDGYPTYNFAHIVDDIEMGVTLVTRAQEFIASTPKFLSVYEALGIMPPAFATLPPIMASDGKKKLGKRDGAKDILEYRKEGYLPSAMVNFLAFLGWNPGTEKEIFTKEELIQAFDIKKIGHSGAQLNEEKLLWVNREHLKLLSYEEQEEYIINYLPERLKSLPLYSTEILHNITPIIIERISVGKDIVVMAENGELDYFFQIPTLNLEILTSQVKNKEENFKLVIKNVLEKVVTILDSIEDKLWTKEKVKESLWDYATETGRGLVLWTMRYILSGLEKSPDPFVLSEALGKEQTLLRIKQTLKMLD